MIRVKSKEEIQQAADAYVKENACGYKEQVEIRRAFYAGVRQLTDMFD